jgi:hypothetical protein
MTRNHERTETMTTDHTDDQQSLRVYASNWRTLLGDVERAIAGDSGDEPTRVVGRVNVDALEAHAGATKRVELFEPGTREPPAVAVPPRARHLDALAVGAEQIAIVRIVPAKDRLVVRLVALAGLLLAVGFLLYLVTL